MKPNRSLLVAVLALCSSAGALSMDAQTLLRRANEFRAGRPDTRIDVTVKALGADGAVSKERAYSVYTAEAGKTVVVMRSPSEVGQKVLMADEQFWMVLPNSQRPMRITPMQKLLGDASVGDIATSSWVGDYEVVGSAPHSCEARACEKLDLRAARPSVTYQRMVLIVDAVTAKPISADLYLQSDKLAKQARFTLGKSGSGESLQEMVFRDALANGKTTRISYGVAQKYSVPKTWLNPMGLIHSGQID